MQFVKGVGFRYGSRRSEIGGQRTRNDGRRDARDRLRRQGEPAAWEWSILHVHQSIHESIEDELSWKLNISIYEKEGKYATFMYVRYITECETIFLMFKYRYRTRALPHYRNYTERLVKHSSGFFAIMERAIREILQFNRDFGQFTFEWDYIWNLWDIFTVT